MTEPKLNNMFFALWPDQEVRAGLVRLQQVISGQNGRLHHPEDLHMTLVFLGKVTPEQLPCVRQVGDAVAAEPFVLELSRTGYWKRPRILWCGPDQTPGPLNQLVGNLQQGLSACGFQPEQRIYKPHVTLVRKARPVENPKLNTPIIWRPREFVLAGSRSDTNPPRYRILERWNI